MTDINILAKNIKSRRESLGMSQEELAKKVGYRSRSSVNKLELGINDIPQSRIKKIATALATTPAALMGWEDEKNTAPVIHKTPEAAEELINLCKTLSADDLDLIADFARTLSARHDKTRHDKTK